MVNWKKTSCVLCAQNCGLEVISEGSKILQVRAEPGESPFTGFYVSKGSEYCLLSK